MTHGLLYYKDAITKYEFHNPEKIRKLIKDIEDRENAKKSREIDFINSMRFNLD